MTDRKFATKYGAPSEKTFDIMSVRAGVRQGVRPISTVASATVCTLVLLAAASSLASEPASARSITHQLAIPAQPLDEALKSLSTSANEQLLFSKDLVEGKQSVPVDGNYTTDQALEILLQGSGLKAERTPSGVLLIKPRETKTSTSKDASNKPIAFGDSSDYGSKLGSKGTIRLSQSGSKASESDQPVVAPDVSTAAPLQEVIITGRYRFLSVDTSGTTNLPLPIEKVPQSISLVSNDFMQAADLKTLGEIAEYTPGAINVGTPLSFGSRIELRGFASGRAIDGINLLPIANYEPDYAIFDRLEIVKGPSSVVYGVSSPGGLVNAVTKSATAQAVDYISLQAGSWRNFRLEGQLAGVLDSDGHVRAIGIVVRDQGNSFIDEFNHQKTSVYGGVNLESGGTVTGYLHGGYERSVRTTFDGIPTDPDGSAAAVPRSFFIGSKYMHLMTSLYHAEGSLTWHVTDALEVSVKGALSNDNTTGLTPYAFGLQTDGTITLGVQKLNETRSENYGIGLSSIYRLDGLGLKDSFVSLAGLRQDSRQASNWELGGYPTINIFDGEAAISQAFESVLTGTLSPYVGDLHTSVNTLAAQSVLKPVSPFSILLGASYSKPDVTTTANGIRQGSSTASEVSYRAGLTYEFPEGINAYVSYSQSFNPQPAKTANLTPLPPLRGEQYEGGVKFRSASGRMLVTGAVFEIKEKNVEAYDSTLNGIDFFKVIGGVTHKGLELQALGQVTREWQLNTGYSYLDPKVTSNHADPTAVGQTEVFLPKHTFSLYTTYTLSAGILPGLSLGAGVRYVSSQRTSYDNSTKDLPGYSVIDATFGYKTGQWLIQLNARNILDKHYFINNYQTLFYGNLNGEPANFALSVRRQF